MAITYNYLGLRCSSYDSDSTTRNGLRIDGTARSKLCHIRCDGHEIGSGALRFINSTLDARTVAGCNNIRLWFPSYGNTYFSFGQGFHAANGTEHDDFYDYDDTSEGTIDWHDGETGHIATYTAGGNKIRAYGYINGYSDARIASVTLQDFGKTYSGTYDNSEAGYNLPSTICILSASIPDCGELAYFNDGTYEWNGFDHHLMCVLLSELPSNDVVNAIRNNNINFFLGKSFSQLYDHSKIVTFPTKLYLQGYVRTDARTVTGNLSTMTNSYDTIEGAYVRVAPTIWESSAAVDSFTEDNVVHSTNNLAGDAIDGAYSDAGLGLIYFDSSCSQPNGDPNQDYNEPSEYDGGIKVKGKNVAAAYYQSAKRFIAISACMPERGLEYFGIYAGGYTDKTKVAADTTYNNAVYTGYNGWTA